MAKKLTAEQEKEIKLLRASNEMYNNTLEEAKIKGNDATIKRILDAQSDVQTQINNIVNATDVVADANNDEQAHERPQLEVPQDNGQTLFEILENVMPAEEPKKEEHTVSAPTESVEIKAENPIPSKKREKKGDDKAFNNVDSFAQYDIVKLPSNGECYKTKTDKIPVGFLTAYDENIIMSPNLYKDGMIIDFLLKNKILNKDVNIDDLVRGDVDAIVLFLRATSYGPEFPVIVRDPETGQNIDSVVDLSKLKYKDFKLIGDENGHFSYTLPISKVEVKFKYLTRKEEKSLEFLEKLEDNGIMADELMSAYELMHSALEQDTVLSKTEKSYILEYSNNIKKWAEGIRNSNGNRFTKSVTNRLEMQIMAIDGNYDKKFIHDAIMKLPARDSLSLRRYMIENEPGVDFTVTIERPESAGGGSFETFLEWGDSVFLNFT